MQINDRASGLLRLKCDHSALSTSVILAFCLSLVSVLASDASAQPEQDFSVFSYDLSAEYELSLSPMLGETKLTRELLQSESHKFSTYNQFLDYLQDLAPEIFERPIMLHHSGSLQSASFENPRVILFGRGAMLTFSEQPGRLDKSVEMLEYDENSAEFVATEIKFEKGTSPEFRLDPQSCTACHGQPLRPIWSPYDFCHKSYNAITEGVASEEEKERLSSFLGSDREGVYSRISMHESSFGSVRDNEAFTQYLFGLNTHRMMKYWASAPQLKPFRYSLAATLNHCTVEANFGGQEYVSLDQFFPAELWAELTREVQPEDYVSRTNFERKRFLSFIKRSYLQKFVKLDRDLEISTRLDFFGPPTAHTRFLLEQLGLQWRSWSMSYGENDFDMSIPGNVIIDLATALSVYDRELFFEQMPEIKTLAGVFKPIPYAQLDCAQLQKSSLQQFTASQVPNLVEPKLEDHFDGLAPMSKCVKCHSSNSRFDFMSPKIPFEDSTELSKWLNEKNNFALSVRMIESGKMPEDSTLTELERAALVESLQFIKDQL